MPPSFLASHAMDFGSYILKWWLLRRDSFSYLRRFQWLQALNDDRVPLPSKPPIQLKSETTATFPREV